MQVFGGHNEGYMRFGLIVGSEHQRRHAAWTFVVVCHFQRVQVIE